MEFGTSFLYILGALTAVLVLVAVGRRNKKKETLDPFLRFRNATGTGYTSYQPKPVLKDQYYGNNNSSGRTSSNIGSSFLTGVVAGYVLDEVLSGSQTSSTTTTEVPADTTAYASGSNDTSGTDSSSSDDSSGSSDFSSDSSSSYDSGSSYSDDSSSSYDSSSSSSYDSGGSDSGW